MSPEDLEALEEAISRQSKEETFEKALGRALRRRERSFEDYVKLIGEVRELARKRKIALRDAAKEIVKGSE